jgi:hypothetical protein
MRRSVALALVAAAVLCAGCGTSVPARPETATDRSRTERVRLPGPSPAAPPGILDGTLTSAGVTLPGGASGRGERRGPGSGPLSPPSILDGSLTSAGVTLPVPARPRAG